MATRSDVLQLLKDYRTFATAFGGARPLDETYVSQASYGPAGLILAGAEFKAGDIASLEESYFYLNIALHLLRREHFQEWGALIEPYLSDIADSSVVEDWRKKVGALDEENAKIRRENKERAKKGKRSSPKPEKVGFVFARLQLERHDKALDRLHEYLKNKDLHVVNPKLMSTQEQAAGDAANAQIYAYYQQVRVAGRTHRGAISATAWKFDITEDRVERIIEFRSEMKLATCAQPECERAVYSQNLCSRHYQQELKRRKGKAS
jgi:hypothetical protein